MKGTMKRGTKQILPAARFDRIELRNELAAKINYIPDSIEALQEICPNDVRVMMLNNKEFYDAVLALCEKTIKKFIKWAKTVDESKKVQKAVTLEDLLRSGFYWEDYEQSRKSFVCVFVDKYLYAISPKEKRKENPKKPERKTRMENTAAKNIMNMNIMKFLPELLIIANNQAELTADMLLGDFLDWLDEKSKAEDYTSQVIEALQRIDYLIK